MTPFGLDRLKIIEWLCSLLSLKDDNIWKKIGELEFPKLLLNIMKTYDMNSLLHLKIFNFFAEAIKSEVPLLLDTVYLYLVYSLVYY